MRFLTFLMAYQFLTSLISLIMTLIALLHNFTSVFQIPIVLVLVLLAAFNMYSAYTYFTDIRKGLTLSIIAQLLQVIGFNINGVSFVFCMTPFFYLHWMNDQFGISIAIQFFSSHFMINLSEFANQFSVFIYVLPIFIAAFYYLQLKRLKKEELELMGNEESMHNV